VPTATPVSPWSDPINRMLSIDRASVASVIFASEAIVVGLRRRARRLVCPSYSSLCALRCEAWAHLAVPALSGCVGRADS
jgi:hypothetical protein